MTINSITGSRLSQFVKIFFVLLIFSGLMHTSLTTQADTVNTASSKTALTVPKAMQKPGGIAIIDIPRLAALPPKVSYQGRPVLVVLDKQQGLWRAIVGISLKAKSGQHSVQVTELGGQATAHYFSVKHHPYKTQRLTIKNKNKVNPNAQSMQRIVKEQALKKSLLSTHSEYIPDMDFIRPTSGRDSGRYGLRRIINGQSRNPHSGMDIAAPQGRSIKSAAAGKVLYTGNLFFSGNVVIVDHGSGLITLYAHMHQFAVKKGQLVAKGETLGTVGKTGRVTGAHLHWSVYLNGEAIDPALFI